MGFIVCFNKTMQIKSFFLTINYDILQNTLMRTSCSSAQKTACACSDALLKEFRIWCFFTVSRTVSALFNVSYKSWFLFHGTWRQFFVAILLLCIITYICKTFRWDFVWKAINLISLNLDCWFKWCDSDMLMLYVDVDTVYWATPHGQKTTGRISAGCVKGRMSVSIVLGFPTGSRC